mgnify:CR=1 FL=1
MKHISKYMNMDKATENQNLKLVGAFLIGIIVGGFSIWMWTATKAELSNKIPKQKIFVDKPNKTISKDKITSIQNLNNTQARVYNDSIIVKDQAPGFTVNIKKAVLEEDGWVVIHEGTVSHIGNALGAARFNKGEYNNVVVDLLRTTKVGMVYRAVLYRDNGDKKFSLDTDFPFLQDGNQPVLTTFTVK